MIFILFIFFDVPDFFMFKNDNIIILQKLKIVLKMCAATMRLCG